MQISQILSSRRLFVTFINSQMNCHLEINFCFLCDFRFLGKQREITEIRFPGKEHGPKRFLVPFRPTGSPPHITAQSSSDCLNCTSVVCGERLHHGQEYWPVNPPLPLGLQQCRGTGRAILAPPGWHRQGYEEISGWRAGLLWALEGFGVEEGGNSGENLSSYYF